MKRIAIALAASLAGPLVVPAPAGAELALPPGFTDAVRVPSVERPIDMAFAPDGRLFIAEQQGRVRIARADGSLITFLNISTKVDSTMERGLSAIAFDPGFASNRYLYLSYTRKATSSAPAHQRIVRVTASGNRAVAGSERTIFRLPAQTGTIHLGGALAFGPDGRLYLSIGDGGGGPTQTLDSLLGTVLRINRDGTIPADGPFYGLTTGKRRAIWLRGFRNPFKMAFDPGDGTLFVNDVGEDAWEEIDEGVRGGNYGWDLYEGPESDPAYVDPFFAYGHEGDPAETGCAITGGAFYPATATLFPDELRGDYFYADLCGGWVRSLDRTDVAGSAFLTGATGLVDLEVGPDGRLYSLHRGSPGTVHEIGYTPPAT